MKKFITYILIMVMCVLPLTACSTDFSEEMNSNMDNLYSSIREFAEPFLKQDEKYNSNTSTDTSGDSVSTENTDNDNTIVPGGGVDENAGTPSNPQEEIGSEIGNKLPSIALNVFDENGFTSQLIDPSETGKVTVINFWGTWCHFCVEELPYFDTTASAYLGSVDFIAIHSNDYFSSTAVDYVNANHPDSDMIFAKDENTGSGYDVAYALFGGGDGYPYTVIIDENGIITYKAFGQISEATLVSEIEKALGN